MSELLHKQSRITFLKTNLNVLHPVWGVMEMEDGNRSDAASTSKSHTGSLHLQSKTVKLIWLFHWFIVWFYNRFDIIHSLLCIFFSCLAPKNEDTYEIAIPYEESNFEQQGFFNQTDQNFDGECQDIKIHFQNRIDLLSLYNIKFATSALMQ